MLSFVVVVLLHVVGGIESLVMVPPLARDTRWCRRHLSHQLVASEFILRFVDWAILRISPCSIIDEATSWHPFSGIGKHVRGIRMESGETMGSCLVWDIASAGIRMDVEEIIIIQQRTLRATHGLLMNVFLSQRFRHAEATCVTC